jgi:hypothetical protein
MMDVIKRDGMAGSDTREAQMRHDWLQLINDSDGLRTDIRSDVHLE